MGGSFSMVIIPYIITNNITNTTIKEEKNLKDIKDNKKVKRKTVKRKMYIEFDKD